MQNRRNMRIRHLMDVTWSMPGEDIAGQGQIVNISTSGLLLQIDDSFKPLDQCVLEVDPERDSQDEAPPFISKRGKVVWFRRIQTSKYAYQCGVEFLQEHRIDDDLKQWVEEKTAKMAETMNASILNNYTS